MIRIVEGAVAVAAGAVDALVQSKVAGSGPGGIPWIVYAEAGMVGAGLFGDKIGLPSEVRDPLAFAGLTLAGARLTHAAAGGALLQGPKAWGGAVGAYSARQDVKAAPHALPANAAASIRLLPGRSPAQSAFSMSPTLFEASGVTG